MKRITLEPWEYDWAMFVAARRTTANWGKNDAAHYDKSRMEDDRTAQAAACVCELAVAKATNRYWSGHVWHKSEHSTYRDAIADVGKNIEVRRVRTSNNAAVRRHQLGKNLVLFVAKPVIPEMSTVDILGWINYDEAWEKGQPSQFDPKNTRLISPQHLTELS